MSNKVQVIFTFERVGHEEKEVEGSVEFMDSIAVNVRYQGLSEFDKTGPQHLYALILKRNVPDILRTLTKEVKAQAGKFGFEMKTHNESITEISDNIH